MIRRVDGDEPCNTDRAGEVNSASIGGDLCAVSNRYRKHQQCGSGEDHQRETCGNQAARGCLLMKFIYLTLLSQNILRNVLRK